MCNGSDRGSTHGRKEAHTSRARRRGGKEGAGAAGGARMVDTGYVRRRHSGEEGAGAAGLRELGGSGLMPHLLQRSKMP